MQRQPASFNELWRTAWGACGMADAVLPVAYIYTYLSIYRYLDRYVYICTFFLSISLYIYLFIYLYLSIHIYIYISKYIYIHIYIHIYLSIYLYVIQRTCRHSICKSSRRRFASYGAQQAGYTA